MKQVFDIGANHGDHTDWYLRHGFDRVIAVEANPELCEFLTKRFPENVVVLNKAVSNIPDQKINFWICNEDGISTADEMWHTKGRFTLNPHHQWTKTEVLTTTVDELVQKYGAPNHIKMDIEGYEPVALKGISLAYCPIRFEWTEEKIDEIEKALYHLKSVGYKYFGPVVEDAPDEKRFDQRPESYWDDISLMINSMKTSFEEQHRVVENWIKYKLLPPGTDPYYSVANEKNMIWWGMMWCFREIDFPKLKVQKI